MNITLTAKLPLHVEVLNSAIVRIRPDDKLGSLAATLTVPRSDSQLHLYCDW